MIEKLKEFIRVVVLAVAYISTSISWVYILTGAVSIVYMKIYIDSFTSVFIFIGVVINSLFLGLMVTNALARALRLRRRKRI